MALLGKIDSFNHNSVDICEYAEIVDQNIFANDIDDVEKETAMFLTVTGSDIYRLLWNLLAPVFP